MVIPSVSDAEKTTDRVSEAARLKDRFLIDIRWRNKLLKGIFFETSNHFWCRQTSHLCATISCGFFLFLTRFLLAFFGREDRCFEWKIKEKGIFGFVRWDFLLLQREAARYFHFQFLLIMVYCYADSFDVFKRKWESAGDSWALERWMEIRWFWRWPYLSKIFFIPIDNMPKATFMTVKVFSEFR